MEGPNLGSRCPHMDLGFHCPLMEQVPFSCSEGHNVFRGHAVNLLFSLDSLPVLQIQILKEKRYVVFG